MPKIRKEDAMNIFSNGYFIFMAILIIVMLIILRFVSASKFLGKYGEYLIEKYLLQLQKQGYNGKVLRNVYIPKKDEEMSEIDVLYIIPKGIFVIESKNYSGYIYGNEKDYKWTEVLNRNAKYRFYNPIKQNRTHIKWLDEYLEHNVPLYSLIVFSERCKLKKITVTSEDIEVINRDRLKSVIKKRWKSLDDVLSEEMQQRIYEKLERQTNLSNEKKQEHIEHIQKRYKNAK